MWFFYSAARNLWAAQSRGSCFTPTILAPPHPQSATRFNLLNHMLHMDRVSLSLFFQIAKRDFTCSIIDLDTSISAINLGLCNLLLTSRWGLVHCSQGNWNLQDAAWPRHCTFDMTLLEFMVKGRIHIFFIWEGLLMDLVHGSCFV